jgi:predicted site-specific integrase-resolvase
MILINNETYYTPKELSTKFNVNEKTIGVWRRLGRLKGYKLSERKYLYNEKDIEFMIKVNGCI